MANILNINTLAVSQHVAMLVVTFICLKLLWYRGYRFTELLAQLQTLLPALFFNLSVLATDAVFHSANRINQIPEAAS